MYQNVRRHRLAEGVHEEDGEGHEDGDDDEGGLQYLLEDLFTLDVGQAALPEQSGIILLMMVRH